MLRRKLNENRDEKLNDVYGKELKASLKKYERLRAHVKESEGTLKEEFAKLKQLMGGVSIDDAVWDVVSEPVLRRLAFARLVMAEAANEHAVLVRKRSCPNMPFFALFCCLHKTLVLLVRAMRRCVFWGGRGSFPILLTCKPCCVHWVDRFV